MSTQYKKLAPDTLAVTYALGGEDDWGSPRLSRIFNFTAQQVVTLYERGGLQEYSLPQSWEYGDDGTGYAAGVTSSMQVHDFADLPNQDEIPAMHRKLVEMKGAPPPLENIMGRLDKAGQRQPGLKTPLR